MTLEGKKIILVNPSGQLDKLQSLKRKNKVVITNFQEATRLLNWKEIDYVVCDYNLADPACAKFLAGIKDTKSYHPNLVLTYSELINDEETFIEIDVNEVDKFIDEIYGNETVDDIIDLDEIPELKLSAEYEFFNNVYLYSFDDEEMLLGIRDIDQGTLPSVLKLIYSYKEDKVELELRGSYSSVDSFCEDEDENLVFLKFSFESTLEWSKFINLHKQGLQKVNQLLD